MDNKTGKITKSKNSHPSYVIYKDKCGEEYIGETERNVEKRWSEHNNPTEKLNQQHTGLITLVTFLSGKFLMPAPKDKRTCKNLD